MTLGLGCALAAAGSDRVRLLLAQQPDGTASESLELRAQFPQPVTAYLITSVENWRTFRALELQIAWPEDAPDDAQVLVHMMDWDHLWFQWLVVPPLRPGALNRVSVDLAPGARGWTPVGHFGHWQFRSLLEPREFAVRVFTSRGAEVRFRIESAEGIVRPPDPSPPAIRHVRANAASVPVFGKFEVRFELPDRYVCPFDPDDIAVRAVFERPDGKEDIVDAFFTQDYLRRVTPAGERYVPQGPPYWAVRYTPRIPGRYRYRIIARDIHGEATWGPGEWEARPSSRRGFVRVSRRDPRHFEFDDGSFFFPLGHNIRSPFDTRHDREFPWQQRFPEGPSAYERHFRLLRAHGANITEIWFAAWSLGLEWRRGWEGYHGLGQYNLMHAWQMDRVVEEAERNGIYLNLVIHNHGKFSDWVDPEWKDNPFNVEQGGYLEKPDDFFTDPRARRDFVKLMRYKIARWGYSPHVFAWELWSELDLTGSRDRQPRPHQRPEVVEWHQSIIRILREMDIYGRLIATHVCGDYTHQNPALISLPEIDFAGIDAYHSNPDPLFIVDLLRRSAEYNNAFGKPVLVTEFGGSPRAQQGVRHVADAFFAAQWASTAIPLGGAPMFWWWHLVEEENYFPVYRAVARFIQDVDRRDPELLPRPAQVLRGGQTVDEIAVVSMSSPSMALGWMYAADDFSRIDPDGPPRFTDLELQVTGLVPGSYRVEFWNTRTGGRISTITAAADETALRVSIPPFARDLAYKIRAGVAEAEY